MSALFRIDGDRFIPDPLTRGGWSDDAQHGSPPTGLLARAVERVPTASDMLITRFTIDLFRAVPLKPLTVATAIVRDGRRIQVVSATLLAEDVAVARATALRVRLAEVDLDEPQTTRLVPGPDELPVLDWRGVYGDADILRFHTDALEIRTVDGSFLAFEPGRSWVRMAVPLVEEEVPTPFQRVATLADVANGNAQMLDPSKWLYVNPDISVALHRYPIDEWIGMTSEAFQEPSGIGMTDTAVFDRHGRIGRITQAQVVEPR